MKSDVPVYRKLLLPEIERATGAGQRGGFLVVAQSAKSVSPHRKPLSKFRPGKAKRRYTRYVGTVDIGSLNWDERLRLLEELWESLRETPEAIPLTNAQREELDRRLDELDREGPTGIPWDDVMQRIRSRAP